MKDFLIRLKGSQLISGNTLVFTFDTSGTNYTFKPGQYAHFTLLNPLTHDKKGHSRPFSIASSPLEKDIIIAARKGSSVFLENLSALPPGSKLFISKASGSMHIEDTDSDIVFIAGGIGITPVMSILKTHLQKDSRRKFVLFYLNSSPQRIAFLDEFEKMDAEHENFTLIPVVSEGFDEGWKYESGALDKKMLEKYIQALNDRTFFVTGPPQMVNAVMELLEKEGVSQENIISEKFK